jgi:hypothetical protein
MAGITLILGLVYKKGIYILDIISGLVPETGTGTGTGTDGRLWYCLSSDWSVLQYQYPYQYYIPKLQPCVLVQHWFLQATAFYAQTIFPIKFGGSSLVSPLFCLQNSQISY